MIKPRRVIPPGYVTHSGNMINSCTTSVGEICWENYTGGSTRRWSDTKGMTYTYSQGVLAWIQVVHLEVL
jgi:hypothetical protein